MCHGREEARAWEEQHYWARLGSQAKDKTFENNSYTGLRWQFSRFLNKKSRLGAPILILGQIAVFHHGWDVPTAISMTGVKGEADLFFHLSLPWAVGWSRARTPGFSSWNLLGSALCLCPLPYCWAPPNKDDQLLKCISSTACNYPTHTSCQEPLQLKHIQLLLNSSHSP